jgi:hypothetical protein
MTVHAPNIEAVLEHTPASAPARLVHLALAATADENGHAETTLHSLEHITGMRADWVASILGQNELGTILIPAAVTFADDVVKVDLLKAVRS